MRSSHFTERCRVQLSSTGTGSDSQHSESLLQGRNRGFLAVSHSWLRDTGGIAIDSVICDVLLVSRNIGGPHLYSLCDAVDEKSLKYSKRATKSIKKHLSENCGRGQRFYLSYHVLPCRAGGEVIRLLPDDRYPKSYDFHTPRAKLNEILKAVVKTVAALSALYFVQQVRSNHFQSLSLRRERPLRQWNS